MRTRFNEELAQLHQEVVRMGNLCETSLSLCLGMLFAGQPHYDEVRAVERQIDRQEVVIQSLCNRLLLLEQPVATDLRTVSSSVKLIADLERIGDQTADIAEMACQMQGVPFAADELKAMAASAQTMVSDSVQATISLNETLAQKVIDADAHVDACFIEIRDALVAAITAHPGQAAEALDLLMIAKYLERIADHAVNVAEWVQYARTGQHPLHHEA